jgi:hypothetical protein
LRDSYAATIMPLPRCQIPILTVAGLIQIAALQASEQEIRSSAGTASMDAGKHLNSDRCPEPLSRLT